MLQTPWNQRQKQYDIVIIGSGYGGAITAARLATANLDRKRSICILERGKERQPGDFPEQPSMSPVSSVATSILWVSTSFSTIPIFPSSKDPVLAAPH